MRKTIFLIFVLAFPLICLAQDATSHASPKYDRDQPLTLTIKADKEVYEAGEDIKLIATIKNNSDKEMIFFWSDKPPAEMSGGGGTSLIINAVQTYRIDIKPKEAIERLIEPRDYSGPTFVLHYNSPTVIDFKHRSDQEIFTGTLTSNTITIEVAEKKGILKEEAIKLSQDYIKAKGITVIDVNNPSKITEQSDSWLVEYEYPTKNKKSLPPPFYYFVVNKKTGEINQLGSM